MTLEELFEEQRVLLDYYAGENERRDEYARDLQLEEEQPGAYFGRRRSTDDDVMADMRMKLARRAAFEDEPYECEPVISRNHPGDYGGFDCPSLREQRIMYRTPEEFLEYVMQARDGEPWCNLVRLADDPSE